MNIVKWLGYILLLGLFIWFVFFRDFEFNSKAEIKNNADANLENIDTEVPSTIDDEASFIDEIAENQTTTEFEELNQEKTFEEFEDLEVVEEVSPVSSNGIDLNKKFLIVVGSFGNRANADRMLKRVKDSGKDGVIEKINGLNRVITATSDDQNDAQNLRDHFTHIYKETAFILER